MGTLEGVKNGIQIFLVDTDTRISHAYGEKHRIFLVGFIRLDVNGHKTGMGELDGVGS